MKWNFTYRGGVESKLGALGTAAIYCPIVPAPGDCEDGELFAGMKIGRVNRSTQRKPAPAPLCAPQIPLDQTRDRTRRSGKPATNRLSYGATKFPTLLQTNTANSSLSTHSQFDII
jgi:hypothetical protein